MRFHRPLGHKAYGSIGHLPGSKMGPSDSRVDPGKARICLVKTRGKQDRVFVSEKVDGANVSVANIEGDRVALTRGGYLARDSEYEHHRLFADWVEAHKARFAELRSGERIAMDWLALAHGTRYRLPHEPVVAFDLIAGKQRLPHAELHTRAERMGLTCARVLHDGGAVGIDEVMAKLTTSGHGAVDPVEGAVWRVETHGAFAFIAKFVRPDYPSGKYMTEFSGEPPVWNWHPTKPAWYEHEEALA